MFDILVGKGLGVGLESVGRRIVGCDPGGGHQASAFDRGPHNMRGSFGPDYRWFL